jgi:hypothetical protein
MKSPYRLASLAALVVGSIWAFSQGASAAIVSIEDETFVGNAPLTPVETPVSTSGNFQQSRTDSIVGMTLSPYLTNTDGLATTAPYSVLGNGNNGSPSGSATYNLGMYAAILLWGSPDPYNQVAFFSGPDGTGNSLGTFKGTDLACFNTLCHDQGFDLVYFSTEAAGDAIGQEINIGSAVLSNSGSAAFEFAGPMAIPLPPAIYLFGSVLGGAFWLGRRKRSAVSGLGAV